MHLTSGLPRKLRSSLKGFAAIQEGRLEPLVAALTRIDTTCLARLAGAGSVYSPDAFRCVNGCVAVLTEIECLQREPDERIFAERLARFASRIRAARRFRAEQEGEYEISLDQGRSKLWFRDRHGREMLVSDCFDSGGPKRVFRCEPGSVIAQCAQALWVAEQAGFSTRSILYRVPTRKELREFLGVDEPSVTKLCRAEGFGWLPRASSPGSR